MNRKRMAALCIAGFGIPWIPAACRAGTEVVGIRHWTAPDHTRIVLDLSGPAAYTHRTLTGPHRVVIEIPRASFARGVRPTDVADGLVDRVRVNALRSGTAQIVIDLPEAPVYKTFSLTKVKDKKDRIVVDLLREVSEAEKAAVRERVTELKRKNKAIVVIDPGHGGEDPGAVGPGRIYEKDIVLEVCLEMARLLEKDPDVEVFLTRKGDYSVSLAKRQQIARDLGADLFMSVHANAARASKAAGAEVFFLSMRGASDAAAKALAEAENEADLVGGVSAEARGDIEAMLCDLSLEDTLRRSSRLAELVHEELSRAKLTRVRNVKQAGFVVLKTVEMPAVLVELGFLSNSADRKTLCKASHREAMAAALVESVRRYLERFPPGGAVIHVVSRGENLWRIARAYGKSVQEIQELNDLKDSDRILVGQRIRVQ